MIKLALPAGPLRVVCLGAHPDDIEIGCGATLLGLAEARDVEVVTMIASGTPERCDEARKAGSLFVPGGTADVRFMGLRDGYLPSHWAAVKESLEQLAEETTADIVFAPRPDDAHQDHRLLAELVPTVWRDALVLNYEVPKWDGDLGRVTHYAPAADHIARRKVELLTECFSSQVDRDWWTDETFFGLMRLRGIECRALYAEGFTVQKTTLSLN